MFVYSFKASTFKILCVLCVCIMAGALVVALMPEAGYAVNVNKVSVHSELDQIPVKSEKGRIEYLKALGFTVEEKPSKVSNVKIPQTFDAATEQYNNIQKMQGFDLEKYKGKTVNSYSYVVKNLPDNTNIGNEEIIATLIIYKNKVIGADISCSNLGTVSGIIRSAI